MDDTYLNMNFSKDVCASFCESEMWSEAIKILKGEYAVRAIKEHKMDQAIIFCRTKIDCDNMEQYFIQQGGGRLCWNNLDFFCLSHYRSLESEKRHS